MTRAELLRELSVLLDVRVVDVERPHDMKRFRWVFFFHARDDDLPGRWLAGKHLRNPRRLNEWTQREGRPATLRPLTAEDGHRAALLANRLLEEGEDA